MYWYSDDRSIQFNFNGQKSGRNRAFYGHWYSPVFLTNILKYRLDRQLVRLLLVWEPVWLKQGIEHFLLTLIYYIFSCKPDIKDLVNGMEFCTTDSLRHQI